MIANDNAVRILVVDDVPENLVSLGAILDDPGYELTCAASGEEALRHLMERELAVVLLDVQMPGLDGIETARLIRQRAACRDVPIIFITAYADVGRVSEGYGVGAVDYLIKPCDPAMLKAKVDVFAELFRAREAVSYLAYHDALTGLPNRRLFADRFNVAVALAERSGAQVTVGFLDLDRFKDVNDTHGHGVGDLLVQAVAQRLRGLMRKCDTLARFGGDEFLLALPDIDKGASARLIAQRIVDSFSEPFVVEGRALQVTASLGFANYPEHATDLVDLLRFADIALYAAKHGGRNRFSLYVETQPAAGCSRPCQGRAPCGTMHALCCRALPSSSARRPSLTPQARPTMAPSPGSSQGAVSATTGRYL